MFKNESGEDGAPIETLIGEKSRIKGDIQFTGGLHIDGEVDGSVTAAEGAGVVHLSESAVVKGELRAPVIVVNGKVEGDVHADDRLELREKARVSGNIHYQAIEMRLGAEVNGQLVSKSKASVTPVNSKPAASKASGADA
ncbi:MAG: polymer-forming cytoskeletal protein [Pseudomonadota bacterium]